MNDEICAAIGSKQLLHLDYGGGSRTVEPYVYGVSTAGNEVLRAFQTGGHSQSGQPIGWKLFRVAEILNLVLASEHFTADRPGYNPDDSDMTSIHCRVEASQ